MRTPFAAVFSLILALAAAFGSAPAQAHGRVSIGVGFGFGAPFWGPPWGPWYYPPPYYYPVPVAVPAQPVTYIEQRTVEQRTSAAPAADRGAWWYYCDSSKGYYPHVKECPSGWQRVPPVLPPEK